MNHALHFHSVSDIHPSIMKVEVHLLKDASKASKELSVQYKANGDLYCQALKRTKNQHSCRP